MYGRGAEEAIVFFNSCMSLPSPLEFPRLPLQSAASCPSLIPSEAVPSPSGMAQDFTMTLSNIQGVRQISSSLWAGLCLETTCGECDWKKREAYGVFASSWAKTDECFCSRIGVNGWLKPVWVFYLLRIHWLLTITMSACYDIKI